MPVEITYKEDKLREEFFNDHPWELARPRVVLENDGKDARSWDWAQLEQPGKMLDGERCVVARCPSGLPELTFSVLYSIRCI